MPAARRLRVDHTTVSRRAAELERALNCKLFDRTQNGFILTDAGQRLLIYAEAMEAQALAIGENIGGTPAAHFGTVRVATMEGIASQYLALHMKALHDVHPGICVELVTERHLINLTKREADISVSFARPSGLKLVTEKIGTFELRLYAAPAYLAAHGEPQTIHELDHHDFVDYIDDLVSIIEVRWLHDVIVPSRVVFRSSSMIAQQSAAAAGLGLALLPSFSAARDSRLKPILVGTASVQRDIWLGIHEDLVHISRVNAVRRFITNLVRKDQLFLAGIEEQTCQ